MTTTTHAPLAQPQTVSPLEQDIEPGVAEVHAGARVFARDGHALGTVIETSPSCFRVSRLGFYRYWLTRELVRYADEDHVWLHTHGSVVARYRHRTCDNVRC